jgi:hypothetical protein
VVEENPDTLWLHIVSIFFIYPYLLYLNSYDLLKFILLACKVSTLSINYQVPHHPSIIKSPLYYVTKSSMVNNLKMLNPTHMISILNSIFTLMFYMIR